jgi:Zn-dependent protease/CBS domain-containing protein
MDKQTIPLGRILGVPVRLDYSWFLIFALLTWTLAVGYYPAEFKDWPAIYYWIMAAVTAVMLFVSVLLHELGHSLVAIHYKIPVRSITLFIFGGVSLIGAEPPSPTAGFLLSFAGPLVSLALAAIFSQLQHLFTGIAPVFALAKYLVYINLALALFNLVPGFPLDGGGVLRAVIWGITRSMRRATLIASKVGLIISYLFIFFGVWQMFRGNFLNGLWIAFIGWFLQSAATGLIQRQAIQDLLAGHKVSRAMSPHYTEIPGGTTLQQLVDDHILAGQRSFLVREGNRLVGLLTLHHVKEIPRSKWPATTASEAAIPAEEMKTVGPDEDLWTAMEKMDRDGVNQLPVMGDNKVLGILRREDLISYLRILHEMGPGGDEPQGR